MEIENSQLIAEKFANLFISCIFVGVIPNLMFNMKKIFTILLSLLVSALVFIVAAQSGSVLRVDIDDPARVSVTVGDEEQTNLVAGLNEIPVDFSQPPVRVLISARPGAMLVKVLETNGDYSSEMPIHAENGLQFCNISLYSDYGDTYKVTSAPADDRRSAEATFTVDDPGRFTAVFVETDRIIELQAGITPVSFDPEVEKTVKVTAIGKDLYRVTVGDQVFQSNYSYTFDVADGTQVNIEANFPDIDVPVNLVVEGQGAADFIRAVDVDGRPATGFLDEGFKVKAGSELTLYCRTDEYQVLAASFNSYTITLSATTTFLITEPTEIYAMVQKYASFEMTVRIDDPSRITLYRGYHYNNDVIELVAGDNTVEVRRDTPILTVKPADGAYLSSVEVVNPTTTYRYPADELKTQYLMVGSLAADDLLDIKTGDIVRDSHAAIFISDLAADAGFFKLLRANSTSVDGLADGYNLFDFYEGDNPFRIETGGASSRFIYIDGEEIEPEYPGATTYSFSLDAGSVVKVYFNSRPTDGTVIFDVDPEISGEISATHDYVASVADFSAPVEAFVGTQFCVESKNGSALIVNVDGEDVTAVDGKYTFTTGVAETRVAVSKDRSGIVSVESVSEEGPVRNLQGIVLAGKATPEVLAKLPAGIYIVGNRKIAVK